jgi:hypothetical protein
VSGVHVSYVLRLKAIQQKDYQDACSGYIQMENFGGELTTSFSFLKEAVKCLEK